MFLDVRAPIEPSAIEQSVIAGEQLREHFAATGDREADCGLSELLADSLERPSC